MKNILEQEELTELTLKAFMDDQFEDDMDFFLLKKLANKYVSDVPEFINYVYEALGDSAMKRIQKKLKLNTKKFITELLK